MHILCVEQFSNWGGGQRSLVDLLPAFSARGWKSQVVVPEDGPFPRYLRDMGYQTINMGSAMYTSTRKPLSQLWRYGCELPQLIRLLKSIARKEHVDLIYVNGSRFLPPAAWVAKRMSIPIVFHCHCRLMQRTAIILAGVALRLSGAQVIGCCRHAVEPIRSYVPEARLQILYNGVEAVAGAGTRHHRPLRHIGVVGRIDPEKGQIEFAQAVKIIRPHFPECRFSIIGSPMFSGNAYYERVLDNVRGTGIEIVEWQSDVKQVFSSLDLLVVPSSPLEATTRVIPEAFAAKLPVVAFASGGIPEVVKDGETGFLAAAHSPEALARRIMDVLKMPDMELRAVVTGAYKAWSDRYSLAAYRNSVSETLGSAAGLTPEKSLLLQQAR